MAVLRALQATDMRADLGRGIVQSFGSFEIVLAQPARTLHFDGFFQFPVLEPAAQVGDPLGLLVPAPVVGRLTGYGAERLGLPQFAVEGFLLDAATAFQVLFRLEDTQFFQSLVFAGGDSLFGSRFADTLLGYAGADLVWGFDGADRLSGGEGADTLYGGDGADLLRGGAGLDRLWGGEGGDRLLGGAGDDWLNGEDGADALVGGRGADRMRGGDGADAFRYLALADSPAGSDHRDQIRSFASGEDVIDLRPLDADLTASGRQPFAWIGEAAFTAAGQLRFDPAERLVQGDADGDGRVDFEIALGGRDLPLESDFLF